MDSSHMTEHWLATSFGLDVCSNPFRVCNAPLGIYMNWLVKKAQHHFQHSVSTSYCTGQL